MAAFRLQRAAGKIAIEEAVLMGRRLALGLLEDRFMHRRQRTGRIGVAGIAGQRKGLAAAAAEIDFPEFATLARLRHPAGAAIASTPFSRTSASSTMRLVSSICASVGISAARFFSAQP